jgi:superfamily II DNA/RNA helicase
VMRRMRDGDLQFLVATDIAARGIDLSDLSHVINYTFPESPDVYVHRTGRTGRAGKSGVAVSLVAPREIGSFYYLKLIHKIYPEERRLPSPDEMATRREASRFEQLQRTFAGREISEEMRSLARRVWSTLDGERLMGLALAVVLEEHGEVYAAPAPKEERPETEREPGEAARPERETRRRRAATRELRPRGRDRRGGRQEREGRGRSDRDQERRPKERKLTRTRRGAEEQGAFTTPDGDVEYWETIDDRKETEGTVRLFINLGRQQGVRLPELYEFVLSEAGLAKDQMEKVQVRNSFSFFNVPAEIADSVIEKLSGKSCADREVRVERAKK